MTYSYSAYMSQSSDTSRLSMARQFHSELTTAMTADVSADGKAIDRTNVMAMLKMVNADIQRLEKSPANMIGGGVSYSDHRSAGSVPLGSQGMLDDDE